MERWVSTLGTVESARIVTSEGRAQGYFDIEAKYSFIVNDQRFESRKLKKGTLVAGTVQKARVSFESLFGPISPMISDRYLPTMELAKPGQKVEVHYDPSDPSRSYLDVSVRSRASDRTYTLEIAIVALVFVGLLFSTLICGRSLLFAAARLDSTTGHQIHPLNHNNHLHQKHCSQQTKKPKKQSAQLS